MQFDLKSNEFNFNFDKKINISNLIFVLTLGDPLSSDLDLGSDKTFYHIIAVQSKQEGNLLSLCTKHSPACIVTKHISTTKNFLR